MKKITLIFLSFLVTALNGFPAPDNTSQDWIRKNFSKNALPPFSFTYGGKDSRTFIKSWEFRTEAFKQNDLAVLKYLFTWRDQKSGLIVSCMVSGYSNFPVVEWTIHFRNSSEKNTPVIENARAVDYDFRYGTEGSVTLHHSRGSSGERSDFAGYADVLSAGKNVYMTPTGGRSSDNTGFPFFNVEMPGNQGIIAAIGWSGKWYADVKQPDLKGWSLHAGMERMKTILYPGEEIRTPEICLLFWKGDDRMTGHNLFRQFILKYHSWQIDGKLAELPLAGTLGGSGAQPCNEFSCATESYCVAMTQRYQQFKVVPEVLWIDAGWYTGCGSWWENVGNWTVNKINFPNGLKPVSDAIHKVGAKFILWFEPERIVAGTQFDKLNPEFMIRIPDTVKNPEIGRFFSNMSLFNLGNPEARHWLTNYISELIRANGVDYYRQDFNFDPYPYWKYNDKPNRTGISEIRHIEGLYAYWDDLHKNFPNLVIDNCASGGRRLDLETVSRSSPLWRTDYNYGEPNGYQCHTYGLNFYLPLHGTGNTTPTKYAFRSSMSSAMVTIWDLNNPAWSQTDMQKIMVDFKRLQPYYYGDFYPLTPNVNITTDSIWLAYQQNRPDKGDGIVMAFRRPACAVEQISIKLRGLDPGASYSILFEDTGVKATRTGAELMKGVLLENKEKPGSLLISYHKD
ncbi:MAG: alpha-galactosidase [Bacteroidales bacterium]|jgi:alpha-galactosidase